MKNILSDLPDIISWIIILAIAIGCIIVLYVVLKIFLNFIFANLVGFIVLSFLTYGILEATNTETIHCGKHYSKFDNYKLSKKTKAINDSHFIDKLVSDVSSDFKCSHIGLEDISETKYKNWASIVSERKQKEIENLEKKKQSTSSSKETTAASGNIWKSMFSSISKWNEKRKIEKHRKEWNKNYQQRRIDDLENEVDSLSNQLNDYDYYNETNSLDDLIIIDDNGTLRNCIVSGDFIHCI